MVLYQLSTVRNLFHRSGVVFYVLVYAGADLSVCGSLVPGPQCCSQMNETAFGMTLNNALDYRNVDLGIELRAVQPHAMALYSALTGKLWHSMI